VCRNCQVWGVEAIVKVWDVLRPWKLHRFIVVCIGDAFVCACHVALLCPDADVFNSLPVLAVHVLENVSMMCSRGFPKTYPQLQLTDEDDEFRAWCEAMSVVLSNGEQMRTNFDVVLGTRTRRGADVFDN
jgi:hypothetical protein